jgi:hypothetical protein
LDSPDEREAFYHLYTRVVAGEHLFRRPEKEMLRRQVWLVAERCGVDVLTYAVMANHLHVVVCAPKRVPLGDEELIRRYGLFRGREGEDSNRLTAIRSILAAGGDDADRWRARESRKVSNISEYMKLLKQRFSIWYNQRHVRFGTLWAERFGSLLLEKGETVQRLSAYVDLNPLRAGLCRDPKDYRFCGYAEAVAGNKLAQARLTRAMGAGNWSDAQERYRMFLFTRGAGRKKKGASVSAAARDQVLSEGGKLSLAEQMRCRCRYFAAGGVLGSETFVLDRLLRFREHTGRGKRMEPRPAGGAGLGLAVMRNVRSVRNAPDS